MSEQAEALARRPLIIDRPQSIPMRERVAWGFITIVFWIFWAYLWSPLITLAGWGVGIYLGYRNLALGDHGGHLWEVLLPYAEVIVLLGVALLGWAHIQWRRFRNQQRRRPPISVTAAELAKSELTHADLSIEQIEAWQRERRLEVEHDAAGRVTGAINLAT
jgi:biofilm PGA synthesis protein PgaD